MNAAITLASAMLAVVEKAADGHDAPIVEDWPGFLALFYALAFTALVCACAFKDARRTHLD